MRISCRHSLEDSVVGCVGAIVLLIWNLACFNLNLQETTVPRDYLVRFCFLMTFNMTSVCILKIIAEQLTIRESGCSIFLRDGGPCSFNSIDHYSLTNKTHFHILRNSGCKRTISDLKQYKREWCKTVNVFSSKIIYFTPGLV